MKPMNRRLDDGELKSILMAERQAALGSQGSSDLSEQRAKALEYYMGKMNDMPADEGESSAVSSDVQDVIEGALPIIADVLTSGSGMCEFDPASPNDEAAARQETDYVSHVIYKDNDGFLITLTAIKDILLQKNGFTKWWMEDEESRNRETYKGLTEDAYAALAADKDGEIIDTEEYEEQDPLTGAPIKLYNAIYETVETNPVAKIASVPPEEILISKAAGDNIQDAPYWAHVTPKAQADLINMFPDKEDIIIGAPTVWMSGGTDNDEGMRRQSVLDNNVMTPGNDLNKDMRLVEFIEHYIRLALEKDKVVRRYKISTTGDYQILDIEEVTDWPIAVGIGILMPHKVIGRALADLVLDVQRVQTALLRSTLNNAYYSNNARIEVSETHSNENTLDDILNNRVGGIVRTKMPGGLTPLPPTPIGNWILPVIEHMDQVRDKRTGVTENNTGMDPDSLNHSRTGAVSRIMDAAEMRLKLVARMIVETWGVQLYRGVHAMLQRYDERQRVVKLKGQWVTVSPREWKTRRHMDVSIPLGGVSRQQLLTFFTQMITFQQQVVQFQGGGNGPLVSFQGVRNALDQMVRLAGLKSADPFFMQPPPPDPNAPAPPNPEMVKAQGKVEAEKMKTQAKIVSDQAALQAEQQSNAVKLQFEQGMAVIQAQVDKKQAELEFAHQQALDRMQFEHDAQMEAVKAAHDMEVQRFKAEQEALLNQQQAKLQAKTGKQV